MLAGRVQALTAPPAAVVVEVPRPSVFRGEKRLAEDQLVTAGAARPHRLAVVPPTQQLVLGPEVDQVHQALAAL